MIVILLLSFIVNFVFVLFSVFFVFLWSFLFFGVEGRIGGEEDVVLVVVGVVFRGERCLWVNWWGERDGEFFLRRVEVLFVCKYFLSRGSCCDERSRFGRSKKSVYIGVNSGIDIM